MKSINFSNQFQNNNNAFSEDDMFLRNVTRRSVATEQDYIDMGLHLGFDEHTISQNRTDNPHSIEIAAWRLACKWWYSNDTIAVDAKKEILKQTILGMGKDIVIENLGL